LLVTLACATVCKLGNEGALRAKYVLERNTTLTEFKLFCEGVIFGVGGEGMGFGSRSRARCFLV
jgi:hypothetical protein